MTDINDMTLSEIEARLNTLRNPQPRTRYTLYLLRRADTSNEWPRTLFFRPEAHARIAEVRCIEPRQWGVTAITVGKDRVWDAGKAGAAIPIELLRELEPMRLTVLCMQDCYITITPLVQGQDNAFSGAVFVKEIDHYGFADTQAIP